MTTDSYPAGLKQVVEQAPHFVAPGKSIIARFEQSEIHGLVYGDEFFAHALEVRDELLSFKYWSEMLQQGQTGNAVIKPENQNGITTGHLTERHREHLPHCLMFRDWLQQNLNDVCGAVGVPFEEKLTVEINAMAYGYGGWLSPHTDSGGIESANDRLIAWMLYLTHPEDGEWPIDRGGACRLWVPHGQEIRLRPKFNRFAMFRVTNKSFHEIERVNSNLGWERCRLALSGWIRGSYLPPVRKLRVYLKSADFVAARFQKAAYLEGSLAMYELMLQQKAYTGGDTQSTAEMIRELRDDLDALQNSPDGTVFLRRMPGPGGCIMVLGENQEMCFLGVDKEYVANDEQYQTVSLGGVNPLPAAAHASE
jgi:Rps23 Pro-64 3,4-dihydroxylase Tpa1-like proline 4-hydroxylase